MVDEKCELLFKSRRFGDTLLQAIENAFFSSAVYRICAQWKKGRDKVYFLCKGKMIEDCTQKPDK